MQDITTPFREIPLTQGKVALVDHADYADVAQFKWIAHKGRGGTWYARRAVHVSERSSLGGRRSISLHRYILRGMPAVEVDHKNRDGLDCRRENLRRTTRSRNAQNSGPYKGSKSGFKGVSHLSKRPDLKRRWYAQVSCNGKTRHLGYFLTAIDAAHAYDAKAKELYGEFAYLNFPESETK